MEVWMGNIITLFVDDGFPIVNFSLRPSNIKTAFCQGLCQFSGGKMICLENLGADVVVEFVRECPAKNLLYPLGKWTGIPTVLRLLHYVRICVFLGICVPPGHVFLHSKRLSLDDLGVPIFGNLFFYVFFLCWKHWLKGCVVQPFFVLSGFADSHPPSGKLSHNYGKSPCYQWVNPL